MSEQILRTFKTHNGNYALTQGNRYRVSHLFYKPQYIDGSLPEYELRSKVYLGDGSILRYEEGYSIVMPKGGTGKFSIIDGEYRIEGLLEKGKLAQLEDFYMQGKSTNYRPCFVDFGEGGEKYTRSAVEGILRRANEGVVHLHNQTMVMLKKILKFLPK